MATVTVPALRMVGLPAGEGWMRLADAEAAGVDLGYVLDSIGPRRQGVIYFCAYWQTTNIVHDVFVKVADMRERGRRFRRAVAWQVAEENSGDGERVRRHMTSWTLDRRDRVISTPEG